MYELIQTGDQTYYINAPAKIGVYLQSGGSVYLIDSGSDKGAGRKVRQILDRNGWTLNGIINTHSHADHIGGNCYLQKNTGCMIYASGIEASFINHPILESSYIFGGRPMKELRHKFLLAQESLAVSTSSPSFPDELEVIPLPGHSFDMIGVRTPDGTVFLGDCLSSRETIDKYRICFLCDPGLYIDTLRRVSELDANIFVPSHASACQSVRELAEYNIRSVNEIKSDIVSLCSAPKCFCEVLSGLFDKYSLVMTPEQYALVGSTVRSYLSWMSDCGELKIQIDGSQLKWASV